MRAAVHTRYGPPEVVNIKTINKPVPGGNDLLIKVHYSTVNRTDAGFRSAQYFISRLFSGLFVPKSKTLGNEFAGVVEETGKDVSFFKVGDRVFGYNDQTFGGHAEYMTMHESSPVAVMPSSYNFEQAAPLLEGSHYALSNLRAARVKQGDQVLVNGATGAIGSAMVQLLKYFGATVTAVCDTKNLALVRSLGADRVIDYTREDFTKEALTYDYISDAVGKSSFAACKKLLKPKGIYISTELGKYSANIFLALVTPLTGGRKVLFPIPGINKQDVLFFKELAESGKFRPLIDRSFKLEEIVQAYKYVESGMKTGNVLLKITE